MSSVETERIRCQACLQVFVRLTGDRALPLHRVSPDFSNGAFCAMTTGVPA